MPSHFTKESFEAVIADTADPHPSSQTFPVEFLWLDIACINQTPGSADKAREIGRQAKIFKAANQVFIWLTTHDIFFYNDWASRMDTPFGTMCSPGFHTETDIDAWAKTVKELIYEMITDPWFSSLWTLQETFLSPDAVIMPGDAKKGDMDLMYLRAFAETLETFKDALRYDEKMREADKLYALNSTIDRTGLLVCFDKNAMGLLTAAGYRTTVHDEDRVYGIMQVFDLQLGNSAPNADPNQRFTIEELNDQLGEALLKRDPVMSQMHVFEGAVTAGKGWRFNRSSVMPKKTQSFYHRKRAKPEIQSQVILSTIEEDGSLWGSFSGLTISFRVFVKHLMRHWPNAWSYGSATLLLDKEELDSYPKQYRATSLGRAAFLAQFGPAITILLLGLQSGARRPGETESRSAVGLLLRRRADPISEYISAPPKPWQRIGLLIWSIEQERQRVESVWSNEPYKLLAKSLHETLYAPEGEGQDYITKYLPILTGDDSSWKCESGLFG
ncbi:MAG: hypothetical protein Q9180_001277 [Flavoplaca navasiana]